jgi:hypothetical protein
MKRLWGILRVFGLALAILGVVVALTLRRAEARLLESLRGFGDQIAKLQGLTPHTAPRKLVVNGFELHVMTAGTSLSVSEALDRFQSVCRSFEQLDLPAEVKRQLADAAPSGSISPKGVMRRESREEGVLACLDMGDGLDRDGLLARLTLFAKTQNLRDLGQLRFALARRSAERTTLIMFWSEGDAKLNEMFPANADAPGSDLRDLPRPERSMRTLSAFEAGAPYGIAFYSVSGQPRAAVEHAFKAKLTDRGWTVRPAKNHTLVAMQHGRTVLVQLWESAQQRVVVALSDLG